MKCLKNGVNGKKAGIKKAKALPEAVLLLELKISISLQPLRPLQWL